MRGDGHRVLIDASMEKASAKGAPARKKTTIKGERTKNGLVNGVVSERCGSHPASVVGNSKSTNNVVASKTCDDVNHKADANENCLAMHRSEQICVDGCEIQLGQPTKKRKNKGKTKNALKSDAVSANPDPLLLQLASPSTSSPNRLEEPNVEDVLSDVAKLDLSDSSGCSVEPQQVSEVMALEQQGAQDSSCVIAQERSNLVEVDYVQYESELQMPMIMKIIQKDLSEPYSIYTYRYFIHNWPQLCFLAMCEGKCVGAIVCKLDFHRKSTKRGYIAMLAVDKEHRKRSIGSTLVSRAIREMVAGGADEVVLETEVTNVPALRLYEQLGFVRDKRLFRYYLNGVDALRLKLWLR